MKQITPQQINVLLETFYQTNISAKDFAAIQKFFADLPEVEEKKEKNEKNEKKENAGK